MGGARLGRKRLMRWVAATPLSIKSHEHGMLTQSFVMRGLDPRIHLLRQKFLAKMDGLPGQAGNDGMLN
jgi:hypothetical protein